MPLQRRTLFQPPPSDTGAAEVYSVAADALNLFTEQGLRRYEQIVTEEAETQGRAAGVDAGLGGLDPAFRDDNTVAASRYNAALATAYGATIRTDVAKRISEAQAEAAEAGNDVDVFDAAVKAYADGNLSKLDPRVAPLFRVEVERVATQARQSVVTAHRQAALDQAEAEITAGLEYTRRQALIAAENGRLEEAIGFQQDYLGMVELARSALGQSAVDTEEALASFSRAMVEAAVIGKFRQAADEGGGSDYIGRFAAGETPEAANMTEEERAGLIDRMTNHLADRRRAAEAEEAADDARRAERWAQSEAEMTDLLISGGLTSDWIRERNASGEIDPAMARTALTALREGNQGASDRAALAGLRLDPFQLTEQEILSRGDLRLEDKVSLIEERRTQLADRRSWRLTQGAREAVRRIRDAMGLIEGTTTGFLGVGQGDQGSAAEQYAKAMRALYDEVEAEVEQRGGFEAMEPYAVEQLVLDVSERVIDRDVRQFVLQQEVGRLEATMAQYEDVLRTNVYRNAPLIPSDRKYIESEVEKTRADLDESRRELMDLRSARDAR